MKLRLLKAAAALLLLLISTPALATYRCVPIVTPGINNLQVWQINNLGQLASNAGIYTPGATPGGTWVSLPAPPASSGYLQGELSALGINDLGVIAGNAYPSNGSSEAGFVLDGGVYTFFKYPGYINTEVRSINNSGIMAGWAGNPQNNTGDNVALVYNPSGAPGYPPGFTPLVPTLNGRAANGYGAIIGQAINSAGKVAGRASFPGQGGVHGWVYDPTTMSFSLFQVGNGWLTGARGINDSGTVSGFAIDPSTNLYVGFISDGQGGYEILTCPELGANPAFATSTGVLLDQINNDGVATGGWGDSVGNQYSFLAYPVTLPATTTGGVFGFDIALSPGAAVFLDPPVAVGYAYATGAGNPNFATVTLPFGIGDNLYTLLVGGKAFSLSGNQTFDFRLAGFSKGVSSFQVIGIEPSAALDPTNPTAFVTRITFAGGGHFTGTMKPLQPVDELAGLLNASVAAKRIDLAVIAFMAKAEYLAGNTSKTCTLLVNYVKTAGRPFLWAMASPALATQARAVEGGVGCP
jgi:hypothetical protein